MPEQGLGVSIQAAREKQGTVGFYVVFLDVRDIDLVRLKSIELHRGVDSLGKTMARQRDPSRNMGPSPTGLNRFTDKIIKGREVFSKQSKPQLGSVRVRQRIESRREVLIRLINDLDGKIARLAALGHVFRRRPENRSGLGRADFKEIAGHGLHDPGAMMEA